MHAAPRDQRCVCAVRVAPHSVVSKRLRRKVNNRGEKLIELLLCLVLASPNLFKERNDLAIDPLRSECAELRTTSGVLHKFFVIDCSRVIRVKHTDQLLDNLIRQAKAEAEEPHLELLFRDLLVAIFVKFLKHSADRERG